jgi:hypothetical protein
MRRGSLVVATHCHSAIAHRITHHHRIITTTTTTTTTTPPWTS